MFTKIKKLDETKIYSNKFVISPKDFYPIKLNFKLFIVLNFQQNLLQPEGWVHGENNGLGAAID